MRGRLCATEGFCTLECVLTHVQGIVLPLRMCTPSCAPAMNQQPRLAAVPSMQQWSIATHTQQPRAPPTLRKRTSRRWRLRCTAMNQKAGMASANTMSMMIPGGMYLR